MRSRRSTPASYERFSCKTPSRWSTARYCSGSIPMANPVQQAHEPALPTAPPSPGGLNFKMVLQEMVRRNASDLHLKVGRPPTIRVDGELESMDHAPLKPEDLKTLAEQLMPARQ